MESAPPGSVALNGCPAWRVAIAAVTLAVVGAMAAWALGTPAPATAVPVVVPVALALAVASVVAGTMLLRCPNGRLAWEGDRWRFEPRPSGGPRAASGAAEGTIAVALDLGNVLLLTLQPDDALLPSGRVARAAARAFPRWLPVERWSTEGDWHGLRVALVAGQPR
jgi:hypothetical protein